jgi:hypothetical protein
VILGSLIEDKDDSSPPFYTSLNMHDKVLHNCLMDSGASHNLMPKFSMDELRLEVTKTYHDLYSFDSIKFKCLGVIKDIVVTLFHLPMKSILMDIVVFDVPPKFGMLLSRSWIKRLGGTLQMDLSYATILVLGGEHRRLYRESLLAYIISDEANPTNHPIFSFDTDLGSSILQLRKSKRPKRFSSYAACMMKLLDEEPSTFEEAVQKGQRKEATTEEHQSIMKNEVCEIIPRPKEKLVVTSKWVYKIKHAVDGSVDKYKARFIARGFSQKEGEDYDKTFAPVARYTSIRAIISLVASMGWNLHQMDVKTDFLNGAIEEEVYIEQPQGFEVHSRDTHVMY